MTDSEIQPQTLTGDDLSVAEARQWYEAKERNTRIAGESGDTLIWGDGIERKLSDQGSIVVVPLLQRQSLAYRIKDNREGKRKKDEDNFISADIKRNVVFHKVRDKIEYFEVRAISDDGYYRKKKSAKLDIKDFDGYVYFIEMNGSLKKGLILENGKIVADFGGSTKKGRISAMVEVCTDWYHQGCTEGYGCSGWIYQNTTCETVNISNSGSVGTLYTTSLDAVLTGGSNVSLESIKQLPYVGQFWVELNQAEIDYFTERWWLLPATAFSAATAMSFTEWFYCNSSDDGNWNAFRHVLMAMLISESVGVKDALIITYNHEDLSTPKDREMDVFNNDLGIKTYKCISNSLILLPHALKVATIVNEALNVVTSGKGYRLLPEGAAENMQKIYWTNSTNRCR